VKSESTKPKGINMPRRRKQDDDILPWLLSLMPKRVQALVIAVFVVALVAVLFLAARAAYLAFWDLGIH
jgi:hypothetical protein